MCRLAAQADILVENFKLGGLKKYGLDYDSLRPTNPGLIYCSITGFGQTGPYAPRPGYDFLIQGMGGLMSITGQPAGAPGSEPMKVGVAICDLFTGLNATTAILAALNYRHETGQGQHIDCALLDGQVAMLANQASNWLNGGQVPQPLGNNHPNVVPYRVFAASDGHLIVACGNDGQFAKLAAALEHGEWANDPRFNTNEARIENRDLIDGLLAAAIAPLSQSEVLAMLEAAGVPSGPINTIPDVFDDPHVAARDLDVVMTRPDGTTVHTTAYPPKLSASPAHYTIAPPALGQHTEEVLIDWGVSE